MFFEYLGIPYKMHLHHPEHNNSLNFRETQSINLTVIQAKMDFLPIFLDFNDAW